MKNCHNIKLRSYLTVILFLALFLHGFGAWEKAGAAEYYVRSGATGNHDGSDWTNAYTQLPPVLDRGINGSIYYIADGHYEGFCFSNSSSTNPAISCPVAFSAAVDETKVITIKKATISEHGTNTGWDNSYGDKQAVFQWTDYGTVSGHYKLKTFRILTSYITIDGSVGSGGNPDHYGFKLVMAPGFGSTQEGFEVRDGWNGIQIGGTGTDNLALNNVTLRHIALYGPAVVKDYDCFSDAGGSLCSNSGIANDLKGTVGNITNLTIEKCLSAYWNNNITVMGATNLIIDGSYLANNWSKAIGDHGQNMNIDSVTTASIKNNHFVNSRDFAMAIHQQGSKKVSGIKVFNNLFYGTNPSMSGFIATMNGDTDAIRGGLEVHHNTLVGQNCGGGGFVQTGTITNITPEIVSYVYNNLLFETENCRLNNTIYTQDIIVHDYNAYINSINHNGSDEPNAVFSDNVNSDDLFVGYADHDYRLKIGTLPIDNGKTGLGETYAYDILGHPRGVQPDVGACEYVEIRDIVAPAAPGGLRVQ